MNVLLWTLSGILAAVFFCAGGYKVVRPWRTLVEQDAFSWARDFTPTQVKLIGLVEIAGACGLVLPPLVGVAEWIVPLAAAGLSLDMLGAWSTHIRRSDPAGRRVPATVLGIMALTVALARYFVEPLA